MNERRKTERRRPPRYRMKFGRANYLKLVDRRSGIDRRAHPSGSMVRADV